MRFLILILLLFLGCEDDPVSPENNSILGSWEAVQIEECLYIESNQKCSDNPYECLTLNTYLNDYAYLPSNIIQSRIMNISDEYITYTISYELLDINETHCENTQSPFSFTWDEDKDKCLSAYPTFSIEIISINETSLCVMHNPDCNEIVCSDFELSNNGNTITYNNMIESNCTDDDNCIIDVPISA